jgi:23S rRNA (cytosine1962-C5)-methyltransferase
VTAAPTAGGPARVAVRVTADAARRVRAGHPWVFDRSVAHAPADAAAGAPAGTVAVVFDPGRRYAGVGLWDPTSPIRVRILAHGSHTTIDADWVTGTVAASIARRRHLAADPATSAYRLVHGENDGLGGLVVDRYGDVAVVKLDTAAWVPWLGAVLDALDGMSTVVLRGSRRSGLGPATALRGRLPDAPIPYRENGLVFDADVVAGQKTGAFLDQRENRARVRALARGARVLDVFCCTGGFSAHAAAGGAVSVTSVDLAPAALVSTTAAMHANAPRVPHTPVVGDAFAVLDRLVADRRAGAPPFDLVVIDPPSFANKAAAVPGALRAYARLARAATALTAPGGTVVLASCSSRVSADVFEAAVLDATGETLEIHTRTAAPADHPVGFPEGAYLTALFGRRR